MAAAPDVTPAVLPCANAFSSHPARLCPQGSPYSVVAILDTIRAIRAPVSTVGFGIVGGTAAAVLAAGTKGRRFSMENTRILLQQPMGGLQGSAGGAVARGCASPTQRLHVPMPALRPLLWAAGNSLARQTSRSLRCHASSH